MEPLQSQIPIVSPCFLFPDKLRAAVRVRDMHRKLTNMFANHTLVGVVDEGRRLEAAQGGAKYLMDYGAWF